jgi:hypothetical protein
VRHIRNARARQRSHASANQDINWSVELQAYVMDGQWDLRRLGARPLHAGCRAPADLVARYFPNGRPAYGPDGPHPEIHVNRSGILKKPRMPDSTNWRK